MTVSHNDRHLSELARLRGARMVSVTETEEGRRWAESRIKQMTGGDIVAANFMRQDQFEFRPVFKLFVAGNHKPGLRSVDEAIRRRLNLIPFTVTIPPQERDVELVDTAEGGMAGHHGVDDPRVPELAGARSEAAKGRSGRHGSLSVSRGRHRRMDR